MASGIYVADELNVDAKLLGLELQVDVRAGRAELRDGARAEQLELELLPKDEWRQDCGTMSSYRRLETAAIKPRTLEIRSQKVALTHLSAVCGAGVELHGDLVGRWIFVPFRSDP